MAKIKWLKTNQVIIHASKGLEQKRLNISNLAEKLDK